MSSGNRKNRKKQKSADKKAERQNFSFTQDDVLSMMEETSELIGQENAARLSSMGPAASESNALTDSVEFWSWMNRNYKNSGHFASSENMRSYISGSQGQQNWAKKVVQGKGYEWDWMSYQRRQMKNLFKTFTAGDVANRPGSDITVHDFILGTDTEQQLKAYTSNNTPNLKNTPKSMTVVTNAEKVEAVKKLGYEDVISFGDNESIQKARDARLDDMASGKATPNYTFENVGATVAKAGIVGFVINAGVETIALFKKWKDEKISMWEYLREIMKSGGNAGVTSTFSAGIMIPVTATITTAGVSSLVTIPVSFVVSSAVDKVIAPAFARGDYKKVLIEASYYRSQVEFCMTLANTMDVAAKQYIGFVRQMVMQQRQFTELAGDVLSPQAKADFEYFASLPHEDTGVVVSGMIALLNDTDAKYDSLKDQKWFQRMLKTVTGKNKATKEDIKRNHERLGIYVSKAVQILYERQCVDETVIQIHGEEIIALCRYNIALNAKVDALASRVDNITNSLLLVTKPGETDHIVSVKQIADENALRTYREAEKLFLAGKLIEAFPLFKEASENGIARADYYLALYFEEGFGHIKEDKSNALEYWTKGMARGDALCTYRYGVLKYDGNEELSSKWIQDHINSVLRLVKNNDSAALYEYGFHLLCQNAGDIDAYNDAIGYFQKAAKNNYWLGAYSFFKYTEDLRSLGIQIPDYSSGLEKVEWYEVHLTLGYAEMLIEHGDYDYSAKHFQKSLWLREDVVLAAGLLAVVLGTGLVKDSIADGYSKANIPMYFIAGLKSKDPLGLFYLGMHFYNGLGEGKKGKDLEKAFLCFSASYRLSKQGFVAGQIGYMCLMGEGTSVDYDKGILYLSEGYQMQNKNATDILAKCYEHGIGVEKDERKAKRLIAESERMTTLDSFGIMFSYLNTMRNNTNKGY